MLEILMNMDEVIKAREILINRRINMLSNSLKRFLCRWNMVNDIAVGELVKSWDVLKTVEFIEKHLSLGAPVLDIGAFASEILLILKKLGYSNLTGIDLNPMIVEMPDNESIRYDVGNFLETPYQDYTFAAITAISVIEHGFDSERLLTEIGRLLKPGGYFIASFDYWPTKIECTELRPFDMSWAILSKAELVQFIEDARAHGLKPVGTLNFAAKEKPIAWHGKDYTFGWLALQKCKLVETTGVCETQGCSKA